MPVLVPTLSAIPTIRIWKPLGMNFVDMEHVLRFCSIFSVFETLNNVASDSKFAAQGFQKGLILSTLRLKVVQ